MKSRFCPSPTGFIHLGNTRTALFNALVAHAMQGKFLLRIEDTDKTRSATRYVDAVKQDLRWLGLEWHEGPEHEQDKGPYFQSQRQQIYDRYYQQLLDQGEAYPCFCSEQELALSRKVQMSSGQPPRYSGKCRGLSEAERAEKQQSGIKPTLRYHVADGSIIEFTDLIKGKQLFKSDDIGDFIIRRADGTSPFMFCNAIDDSLMGVTHALRGEDHLTNTPRQIMILQSLNLSIPTYGHFPLIVGPDGAPLSKRHGSRSIQELREEGYLPMALINYLARLGHYYADNAFMSVAQLAEKFSFEHIGTSPARFDSHQLHHWQKEAVQQIDDTAFWQWIGSDVQNIVPAEQHTAFVQLVKPNVLFPKDAAHWARILCQPELAIATESEAVIAAAGYDFFNVASDIWQDPQMDYAGLVAQLKASLGVKGKQLFMPLRVALTGETHGPELPGIMQFLGREQVLQRLKQASSD
jgi:glutamyl-tRNA synthetase